LAVPALAIALSKKSPPSYQASVKVLLNQSSDVIASANQPMDPVRAAQTQADLSRTQEVLRAAVAGAHVKGLTSDELSARTTVVASLGSDFLTFSATDSDPAVANRLATTYARAYVAYRYRIDNQSIIRARDTVERQIKQLEASGQGNSPQHKSAEQQLAAINGTAVPTLTVLRELDKPVQIGPRVKRNGGIALVLGIVLGLGLAFLWDVLDTRVRSVDTVRHVLQHLPLLGRLATPPRALRRRDGLVMLTGPTSAQAESVRVLRANFEFAVRDVGARTIMFTSGVGGEGKSTTVANLAIALARAGRRVILIDFDLRSPGLHRFFRLGDAPGLTDVMLGDTDVRSALTEVRLTGADGQEQLSQTAQAGAGTLEVLPLGGALRDPDQVRADAVARQIVDQVRDRADYILIDAGPLLPTGDTIALSAHVDAMVVVVRLNVLPLSALDDLSRVLASSPATKIGFVVTGVEETLKPSHHSGQPRRGGDQQGRRAAAGDSNGNGHRKNGVAAPAEAEEEPYATEY
jgi:Mrp family chromosome partitioning ATPase/capsular polysaccharide biosynthesis protein